MYRLSNSVVPELCGKQSRLMSMPRSTSQGAVESDFQTIARDAVFRKTGHHPFLHRRVPEVEAIHDQPGARYGVEQCRPDTDRAVVDAHRTSQRAKSDVTALQGWKDADFAHTLSGAIGISRRSDTPGLFRK